MQRLLVDIAAHVPGCALDMLVGQLLADTANLEAMTVGLEALHAMLLSPPSLTAAPQPVRAACSVLCNRQDKERKEHLTAPITADLKGWRQALSHR